jgi:hypothetical protein
VPQPAEIRGENAWLVSLDGKPVAPATAAAGMAKVEAWLTAK